MLASLSGARPEDGGLASGIVNTTYQVGSALGLAVMTAIAAAYGADEIGNQAALVDGFRAAFVGAVVLAVAGAGLGLAWLRQPRAAAPRLDRPVAEQLAD
jgi:MFS family permease